MKSSLGTALADAASAGGNFPVPVDDVVLVERDETITNTHLLPSWQF